MTVMTDDRTHFENEDWTVLDSGLEHRRTGYFIARDEIGNRRADGLWSWPLHVAEKSWCTMPAFIEAFTCAAAVFAIPADADLAHSFQVARRDIAASPSLARAKAASRAARLDDALGDAPPGKRVVVLKIHKATLAATFEPIVEAVSQSGGEIVHVLEEEK